jgi:hypothetical protein
MCLVMTVGSFYKAMWCFWPTYEISLGRQCVLLLSGRGSHFTARQLRRTTSTKGSTGLACLSPVFTLDSHTPLALTTNILYHQLPSSLPFDPDPQHASSTLDARNTRNPPQTNNSCRHREPASGQPPHQWGLLELQASPRLAHAIMHRIGMAQ